MSACEESGEEELSTRKLDHFLAARYVSEGKAAPGGFMAFAGPFSIRSSTSIALSQNQHSL